jgi:hypothetical protein
VQNRRTEKYQKMDVGGDRLRLRDEAGAANSLIRPGRQSGDHHQSRIGPKLGSRERQLYRQQCKNQTSRNRSNPTSAAYCKSRIVLPSWIAPVLIICSAEDNGSSITSMSSPSAASPPPADTRS